MDIKLLFVHQTVKRLAANPAFQTFVSLLVFCTLIAGGELLVRLDRARAEEATRTVVTARVADLRARLETELNSTIYLTSALVAYASTADRDFEEREAKRLLSAIYANGRHIRNIVVAPDNQIEWIQPLAGNEKLIGLRYHNIPTQWPSVKRAMDTHRTVLAGPVALIQGGTGVIVRSPVFRRDATYWGMLSMVVDWNALARDVGLDKLPPDVRVAIRGRDGLGAAGEVFFGPTAVFAAKPVTSTVEMPGGKWVIGALPAADWDTEAPYLLTKRISYVSVALVFAGLLTAFLHDSAERRRANQELLDLNAHLEARVEARTVELQLANTRLTESIASLKKTQASLVQNEKLGALGSLVAGVAHELNTPIGNSLLAASTLEEHLKEVSDPQHPPTRSRWVQAMTDMNEATGIIRRSLGRANELVSSFKQVAADGASAQRRRFALDATINDLLTLLQPAIKRSGLNFETSIPADIQLDSYPGALDQVLMNLIQNTLTHAYAEGEQGRVRIGARKLGDQVVIWVSDEGRGIPPEHIGKVFDPFFTTRLGRGGTGLGLNIAHNLVVGALGGAISVVSDPGDGACFELRIPLQAPAPEPAHASA